MCDLVQPLINSSFSVTVTDLRDLPASNVIVLLIISMFNSGFGDGLCDLEYDFLSFKHIIF